MRMMLRCLCGILIAAPTLLSNDATKTAKIDQLLAAMNVEQQEAQVMAQARRMIDARIQPQMARTSDPDLAARQKKALALVEQRTSWPHIKPIIEKSYADAFSEEEIEAILAFYRSPAGQKMVQKLPAVTRQVMQSITAEITGLKPQIEEILHASGKSK